MGVMLFLPVFFLFSSAMALDFDPDVDPALQSQLLQDLETVNQFEGRQASPLFHQIFGKLDGKELTHWFEKRVNQVGKNLCSSDHAVACVLSAWGNKIWLSPNYSRFQHPQVARIMVLFHEARHTEEREGHWPHSRCPKNFRDRDGSEIRSIWTGAPLSGERACDLSEDGSYGVATVLLLNLARNCETCSEKVRMDAEIYGKDQLKRIIWAPARARMEQELIK